MENKVIQGLQEQKEKGQVSDSNLNISYFNTEGILWNKVFINGPSVIKWYGLKCYGLFQTDHSNSISLKAVFHQLCLLHSSILCHFWFTYPYLPTMLHFLWSLLLLLLLFGFFCVCFFFRKCCASFDKIESCTYSWLLMCVWVNGWSIFYLKNRANWHKYWYSMNLFWKSKWKYRVLKYTLIF